MRYKVAEKLKVVIHNDEPQVVEENSEVKVEENEEQVIYEDNSAEGANVTNDDQFDEIGEITDECHFATPICDDVLVPIQSDFQPIFAETLAKGFVMVFDIIVSAHIQPDDYYEVFPLQVAYQEATTYSEIFHISDTGKMTCLHLNLIVEGYGLWFICSSSLVMLILSFYKT